MRIFSVKFINILLILFTSFTLYAQNSFKLNPGADAPFIKQNYLNKSQSSADQYIFIGSVVFLTLTPTVVFENKKFYFGLGRELSLVFGKHGEYRLSAEYTFVFRSSLNSQIRAVFKYDILSGLTHSEWIDQREFVSLGAGYFTDTRGSGISPEISAGFRIGSDGGTYIYPYAKLRHTFMLKKDKPDNTDFSLGLAFGFQLF